MKVQFGRINFRVDTVNRFRSFSKSYGKTHSEVLEGMLDFFEKYQLSPFQDFRTDHEWDGSEHQKTNQWDDRHLKDIEKHQTQPTKAMLQLLFEQTAPKEKQPELLLDEFTEVEHEEDPFRYSGTYPAPRGKEHAKARSGKNQGTVGGRAIEQDKNCQTPFR